MTNPTPYTDADDETRARPVRGSTSAYPGTPLWVKVAGIVTLVLILLVVIGMFVLGGSHGPSRHVPSGSGSSYTQAMASGVLSKQP
jgi:hypothetical protein